MADASRISTERQPQITGLDLPPPDRSTIHRPHPGGIPRWDSSRCPFGVADPPAALAQPGQPPDPDSDAIPPQRAEADRAPSTGARRGTRSGLRPHGPRRREDRRAVIAGRDSCRPGRPEWRQSGRNGQAHRGVSPPRPPASVVAPTSDVGCHPNLTRARRRLRHPPRRRAQAEVPFRSRTGAGGGPTGAVGAVPAVKFAPAPKREPRWVTRRPRVRMIRQPPE
jgi:hypothetical protein